MERCALLYVSKKNIRDGVPMNSASCPIALALMDMGFVNPIVDASDFFGYKDGVRQDFLYSEEVEQFVHNFDEDEYEITEEIFELRFVD